MILMRKLISKLVNNMSHRPSPLDEPPCRQCSSFADYVKMARRKVKNEEAKSAPEKEEIKPRRTDCPLDREELGRSTWGLLHTIASKYPSNPTDSEKKDIKDFFCIFSRLYPCLQCAEDFRKELKRDPPLLDNNETLSLWLCHMHNKVNKKLGKEEFDCSKVNERWRDGWADGSCD